jgi:hypothetical protein
MMNKAGFPKQESKEKKVVSKNLMQEKYEANNDDTVMAGTNLLT